tara:strand:+ start:968 stop:1381 length:414 start_codon:yes stop_codon:yes gene_type:complete
MTALNFPNSPSAGQTYTQNGISYTYDGTVWKKIPVALSFSNIENKTSGYSLQASDTGKLITMTTGDLSILSGVFSAGDAVTIHNKSSSSFSILQQSGVTLRFGGTALTGNRTLAQRGLATIVCLGTNDYTICGAGVT